MTPTKILTSAILLLGVLSAPAALAYTSPEDVLLNQNLYLPPTTRGATDRVNQQNRESAERRAREQEILFKSQSSESVAETSSAHPSADDGSATAIDPGSLSPSDLKLLGTIRLLNRVEQSQRVLQYGSRTLQDGTVLHAGAPLAPTGAGSILLATTMTGAMGWTLWRAKKMRAMTRR
ncbi:MAG: hypothetical protein PHE68_01390 [Candidatus Peribacteraceae bacterium]|nr:hypothetical protein [Candidatus Peribacteraceae bacterium]